MSYRQPRTCDIEGCTAIVEAKNLCSRHYAWLRKGKPLPPRRGETLPRSAELPHWTYEGHEEELIAMTAQENADV